MSNNSFCISYPQVYLSTDKSQINFMTGTPDLVSIFKPGENNSERRFFVTDATVASLPCMIPFISKFEDEIPRRDNNFIAIRKFIIQITAKVKIFCFKCCGSTHNHSPPILLYHAWRAT